MLCAHTQFRSFSIYSPRWHDRRVLLADYKLQDHNKILFTGKDGESMGDQPYYISKKAAKKYPKESNGTIMCRAIPLDELQLLQVNKMCEHLYR